MPDNNSYPDSVAEVIDLNMKFRPEVLRAVIAFRRSFPYRGTLDERKSKFRTLHENLCSIYGKSTTLEFGQVENDSFSGSSYYDRLNDKIVLNGRLSTVSMLHEFAHCLHKNEKEACKWSINLFRRIFPRSFSRCAQVGHCLVKDEAKESREK